MEQNFRADIEAGYLVRELEDWTRSSRRLCLKYTGRRSPAAALKTYIGLVRERSSEQRL